MTGWRLDSGAFIASPPPVSARPAHTREQAVAAARSADEIFFERSALLAAAPSGRVVGFGAGYGLVTIRGLHATCAEACSPTSTRIARAARYERRQAWIVWYRVTGSSFSCPAGQPTTAAPSPSGIASHLGWVVFVYPDRLDNAVTFHESHLVCGPLPPALNIAMRHIGIGWRLASRIGRNVTVDYLPPPCGRQAFTAAGSDDRTHGSISIIFAVPFGATACQPVSTQAFTASMFTTVIKIRSGQVGILG
jgi:hypothetical protein